MGTKEPRLKSIFDTDPDFRREPITDYSCVNCHRAISKKKGNYRLVHVVSGGVMYLHPEDEALYTPDTGDCGLFPVGMDCAKKIGIEWTHEVIKDQPHE
jgi:hypothetical protein